MKELTELDKIQLQISAAQYAADSLVDAEPMRCYSQESIRAMEETRRRASAAIEILQKLGIEIPKPYRIGNATYEADGGTITRYICRLGGGVTIDR